ncbi:hypothetical protein [Lentzea indica]|nr:hypothetical protein [Lentzea indica]
MMGEHSSKDADAGRVGSNGTPVQLWYLLGDEAQTNQRWTFKHAGDF